MREQAHGNGCARASDAALHPWHWVQARRKHSAHTHALAQGLHGPYLGESRRAMHDVRAHPPACLPLTRPRLVSHSQLHHLSVHVSGCTATEQSPLLTSWCGKRPQSTSRAGLSISCSSDATPSESGVESRGGCRCWCERRGRGGSAAPLHLPCLLQPHCQQQPSEPAMLPPIQTLMASRLPRARSWTPTHDMLSLPLGPRMAQRGRS